MRYFGGKQRIAKRIVAVLEELRTPGQVYLDPFCGSANVVLNMSGSRIGSDAHPDLILLLQAIQSETFVFPEAVSLEEYKAIRHEPPSALRAFIGFGCSYAGKWFGGYARDGGRNFCQNATNSLKEKQKRMAGVQFVHKDYREWTPDGMLIYCDPPYADHTRIHGVGFDHAEFWEVMRSWSKQNTVVISEYIAPDDFACIKEIPTKTDIIGKAGKYNRVEKLFKRS